MDPQLCSNVEKEQKAVVLKNHLGAYFVASSCGINFDTNEAVLDAQDIFLDDEIPTGLSVWEGSISYSNNINWDPEEADVSYKGKWRELTKEELDLVQEGKNPFKCDLCDGSGLKNDRHLYSKIN